MKKILLLAALGGLFAATSVQAQQSIYICGSTAFRANAYRAIKNLFDAGTEVENTGFPAAGSGAGQMTFQGTITNLFNNQTITIYCDWTGSAQGVHSITASPGDSLPFLQNVPAVGSASDNITFNHTADLAFSDVFQATTGFTTPSLTDTNVAVQPFCWVRSPSTPATVANVTMQQLRYALQGTCNLSYITGNTNDYATTLYFTGRNKDSGSRLVCLSDCAYSGSYSVYSNFLGTCYKMTGNQIVNGVNYGPGWSSGSKEAANIASLTSGAYLVGYLGYSDARTVVAAGGQLLTYNGGLPFNGWTGTTNGFNNPDFTPLITGQYSLWGPEHLLINPSDANFSAASAVWAALPPLIANDVTNVNLGPITALPVSALGNTARTSDGGKINP
jgi:hypothetical protein